MNDLLTAATPANFSPALPPRRAGPYGPGLLARARLILDAITRTKSKLLEHYSKLLDYYRTCKKKSINTLRISMIEELAADQHLRKCSVYIDSTR